ncbi:MAG: FG-GAP-like repeat-containing protein [Gammaproteobacteria bacterium]|nr:FG-GAP-like repeat-containing protein [Gammaproteobacteria bacterium]
MKTPNVRRISFLFLTLAASFLTFQAANIHASSADAGDADNPQQALGISANFGKWNGGTVTWVYNSTNAPAGYTDDTATVALFQAAIDEWAGLCNVNFVYTGVDDSADITNTGDGIVVFEWDSTIGGAAGRAGPTSSSISQTSLGRWTYIDGSLKMNPTVFTFAGGTASEETRNKLGFHATSVHELGHLIGQGHSDRPDSIMYANPYNAITHTMADDVKACRAVYGYSDLYEPPAAYQPPAAGTDTYDFFRLIEFGGADVAITVDDGTMPDASILALRWQHATSPYDDTLTHVVTDPTGALATLAETVVQGGFGGSFGIATFRRLREIPGVWTYYVYDSTGLIGSLSVDVTTSLPDVNDAPDAELTFTENPSTRAVALTTTVTGDAESNLATVVWHVPGSSPTTVALNASSGSDSESVTFNDDLDWEIFAEVNDNGPRYTEDLPNNVGPAGSGFQGLYRYASSGRNHGPDLDGNNSSDVFWRNSGSGQNWMFSMVGNLIKQSVGITPVSDTNWQVAGNGDYNGDGKTDILWRNSITGQNHMYLMDGAEVASSLSITTVPSPNLWMVAGNGDYNGDGKSDILWRHSVTGQNHMYLMDGASIASSLSVTTVPSPSVWEVAGNGDYDGDGNSDILWRNNSTGQNHLYLMNGATVASSVSTTTVPDPANWMVAGSGDYNGDGNSDILWRNETTGQNHMYLMDGATVVTSASTVTVPTPGDWKVVGSGDYNNDGKSDMFYRNVNSGQNWVYLLDGPVVIAAGGVTTISDLTWEIVNVD